MTANANQPKQDASHGRSQPGRAGAHAGESPAGAWGAQQGQRGPQGPSSYLHAIEENVKKLRNALSGAGPSSES